MWTTGMTTSTPTTARAPKLKPHRTQAGSCWAFRIPAMAWGFSNTTSVGMAHAPSFQQVDQHQHDKGNDEQHHSNRCRFTVRELLKACDDQDRCDLRFVLFV